MKIKKDAFLKREIKKVLKDFPRPRHQAILNQIFSRGLREFKKLIKK